MLGLALSSTCCNDVMSQHFILLYKSVWYISHSHPFLSFLHAAYSPDFTVLFSVVISVKYFNDHNCSESNTTLLFFNPEARNNLM